MKPLYALAITAALLPGALPAQQAVDEMVNACLTDTAHPMHDSDLCQAFLYGIHFARSTVIFGGEVPWPLDRYFNQRPSERQRFSITEQEFHALEGSPSLPGMQQFLQDHGLDLSLQPPDSGGGGSAITIAPSGPPPGIAGGQFTQPFGRDLQIVR